MFCVIGAQLARFKLVWNDLLMQYFGVVEGDHVPDAFHLMEGVAPGKVPGEHLGFLPGWGEFLVFKEALELETATHYTKHRTQDVNGKYTITFMCMYGGKATWLARKARTVQNRRLKSSASQAVSAKVECPARIKVKMASAYAAELGLLNDEPPANTPPVKSPQPCKTIEVTLRLVHERHRPKASDDLLNLPTHPRYNFHALLPFN